MNTEYFSWWHFDTRLCMTFLIFLTTYVITNIDDQSISIRLSSLSLIIWLWIMTRGKPHIRNLWKSVWEPQWEIKNLVSLRQKPLFKLKHFVYSKCCSALPFGSWYLIPLKYYSSNKVVPRRFPKHNPKEK